jgi:RHS repeat-associated protein
MPMPNKQITDGNYRYNYQGQEKDPETGMEAFELRLWDGRLGRWLTVDPYHEFDSPYLGMGNNPISLIDPDGGSTTDPTDPPKNGGTLAEVSISSTRSKKSNYSFDFYRTVEGFSDRAMNHDPNRPLGGQSHILDTGRTHTGGDILTNLMQMVVGVEEYDTGDDNYDSGAKFNDDLVLAAELSVPALGLRRIAQTVTAKAIKKLVQYQAKKALANAAKRISSIVARASKGNGNFGLGSSSFDEAMNAGKSWVGDGFRIASDGKTMISANGLRQFRPPSLKPRLNKIQANFEWRNVNKGKWQGNGHLDIK